MKHLRNDNGYALFLTVLILVIFAVLSVSLTTMVFSGVDRSKTREHVTQAGELSEKGIEHLTAQINKDLQDMLGENGIPRSDFTDKLVDILKRYECDNELLQSGNTVTGDYEVCIKAIENIEGNELRKLVTFESTGTTDKQNKEMHAKVEFGAGSVPEVLKYTVGTNIRSTNPKNGEGNLLLHGGVDIYGDIKVEGNLVTYEKAAGGYRWTDSIQPRMQGVPAGTKSRLVLGKNMYKMTRNPYSTGDERTHNSYLNNDNFRLSRYEHKSSSEALFDPGYAPEIVQRNPTLETVKIKSQKDNFHYERGDVGVTSYNAGENKRISAHNYQHNKTFAYYSYTERVCSGSRWNQKCRDETREGKYGDYSMVGTNRFKQLVVPGNLSINNNNTNAIFSEGLYVDGNLNIGNMNSTDDINRRDNLTVEGPIYVDGNVKIQGANLTSNTMMYVDGDVDIRYSSIEGKRLANNELGTLIIFATGNIYLANNSVYEDSPTRIKGYFYSEGNMEIYGAGSNIHIEGGVSANRVVLNALRGRVSNSSFRGYGSYTSGVGYVETIANQRNSDSRLTIKYDTELIENFLKLNPPEPVIREIDPSELIDRQ